MSTQLGSPEGLVTAQQIAFYEARAKGGTGMIIVEFCCVHRASGLSEPNQLALEAQEHLQGHRELVRAICDAGAVACLQLQHGGGAAKRSLLQDAVPWGPDDVYSRRAPSQLATRGMSESDIEMLIECFGRSAALGVEAGYQAVELHGAHGYLLTQFMSPATNQRQDAWGGSEARRLEFPRRVISRVREAIGARPLIFRLSADEFTPLGLTLDDMSRISGKLVEFGVDMIHVSTGVGPDSFDKVLEPMSAPEGWRLPYARRIRKDTGVPVITVGQIRRPETAEQAVAKGDADLVALGRTLLADPDWANKAEAGRELDIIPCTSCNFCVANGLAEKSIACADNPRTGRELDEQLKVTPGGLSAVVIGAGPAGMAAAVMLDEAGIDTELIESRDTVGGGLIAASAPPHKEMLDRYRIYLERQVGLGGVRLRLGSGADTQTIIDVAPDAVFVATGARTLIPPVPGVAAENVYDAYELLMQDGLFLPPPGRSPVVVYGGGETGCETTEYLLGKGYSVVLVTRSPRRLLARAAEVIYRGGLLQRLLSEQNLTLYDETTLVNIGGDVVELRKADDESFSISAQAVVIAQGRSPNTALPEALESAGIRCFVLGDARRGGRIGDAVRDAYEAVRDLCREHNQTSTTEIAHRKAL
jgi:2,4-dienoyl-CoA reductase-like NADH-dependent reductase (Old Yellow Enzyme family)/thioredoxin reductase